MNNLDKQYIELLKDILQNGVKKSDRTGTGTISVFGRQIRHKMSEGFPLITTKKMAWKQIVTELLWFLRGDTNIKYLIDNDCHIWDGDTYKNYSKAWSKSVPGDNTFKESWFKSSKYEATCFSKEEFIEKIKTDSEFANKWGDLGPIYGQQWREWFAPECIVENVNKDGSSCGEWSEKNIDQISELIKQLKENPDSRRMVVNAWAVHDLLNMVLPPCHYGFQCYTRELSEEERIKLAGGNIQTKYPALIEQQIKVCDEREIPKRAISLMWNQRSVDTPLGLPFNIASYGLLLEIIAKMVNMVPDELIGNLGDTHIYLNQVDGVNEQIGRELTLEERFALIPKDEMQEETINFFTTNKTYDSQGEIARLLAKHKIRPNLQTREPFPLPTLSISDKLETIFRKYRGEETINGAPDFGYYDQLDNLINSIEFSDFILDNYKSHSKVNFPLSN
jgi:thymidylate synthase